MLKLIKRFSCMTDIPFYSDYYWSNGKPKGLSRINPLETNLSFRIVEDPYHKRISIERYQDNRFVDLIYDSNLFDFRGLKKEEETWRREICFESLQEQHSIIRNHDDRVILIEEAFFENNICRKCKILSPHKTSIALQTVNFKDLGDPINGVILTDNFDHPILIKHYAVDEIAKEFTTMISEQWNHSK